MLERIVGKASQPFDAAALSAFLAGKQAHIDLGTGDGMFAYRTAKANPGIAMIGVDADRSSLADASFKASKKPARGGCDNVRFVCFNVLDIPTGLEGKFDHIHANFPWGSLMYALVRPDVAAVRRMAALGKSGADFSFYLNLYVFENDSQRSAMKLPTLDDAYLENTLIPGFAKAGLTTTGYRFLTADGLKDHPSTWAGRLIRRSGRNTLYLHAKVAS